MWCLICVFEFELPPQRHLVDVVKVCSLTPQLTDRHSVLESQLTDITSAIYFLIICPFTRCEQS